MYPNLKLIIKDIAFERNYQTLFHSVNAELVNGETLQVLGANGSGKSTLLRILSHLLEPQQGEISWQNERHIFHYLGHENGVQSYLTVSENLQLMAARANYKTHPQQISQVLKKMGLSHTTDTFALNLSAGQRRRLALANLLLQPKTLWILDEPTTALDIDAQTLFSDMLNNHCAEGGIAIFSSHHALSLSKASKKINLGDA